MKSKSLLAAVAILTLLGCSPASGPLSGLPGSTGPLDSSFGNSGIVITPIGSSTDNGSSVAIQSDGKILVAGTSVGTTNAGSALVRYNSNGSLDTSFGSGGKVTTQVSSSNDFGSSVAIQSDGKILVAGYGGTTHDFELVRYNSDGFLDTTGFGTGGKVSTSIIGLDYAYSVAIQSDGKIIVAGYTDNTIVQNFALVRYNSNGTLDTSGFGVGGMLNTAIQGSDYGYSVAIQSDGKILVAGYSFGGIYDDFALLRYNSNGSLDSGFGSSGKVLTAVSARYDSGYSVAIQSDGKILVGGTAANATDNDFALVRYNSDGSLDSGFGSSGKVITPIGSGDDSGYSVAIQSNGKIVVAGYSYSGAATGYDFALVRYNSDGSLDTSFGSGGKLTTAVSSSNDYGYSVAIQSDGKILVAGSTGDGSSADFALVRYLP